MTMISRWRTRRSRLVSWSLWFYCGCILTTTIYDPVVRADTSASSHHAHIQTEHIQHHIEGDESERIVASEVKKTDDSSAVANDSYVAKLEAKLHPLSRLARETLERHTVHTEEYRHLESQLTALLEKNAELERLEQELKERTAALDKKVRHVNALQLQRLVAQLNETVHNELMKETAAKASSEKESAIDRDNVVSLQELERTLDPERILQESDGAFASWLRDVIRTEVAQYQASQSSSEGCVSPLHAARLVQAALFEHAELDQVDHAAGATVVHEMTSETYEPPLDPSQTLGNVWWRRYIPQDWERLLPSGWEDWPLEIPSSVLHTIGLRGTKTLPPEAILDPITHPGSCWPMRGRRGQVTLRLKYPVKVDAFTIDHTSSLLVPDRSSAPKVLRIVGYPPCNSSHCHGLGFDVYRRSVLSTITYDLEGASVQRFQTERDDHNSDDAGSCSEVTASCSADPMDETASKTREQRGENVAISALTVEVLDNWGMEDYTCLYRLRIHGDAV